MTCFKLLRQFANTHLRFLDFIFRVKHIFSQVKSKNEHFAFLFKNESACFFYFWLGLLMCFKKLHAFEWINMHLAWFWPYVCLSILLQCRHIAHFNLFLINDCHCFLFETFLLKWWPSHIAKPTRRVGQIQFSHFCLELISLL